MTEHWVIVWDNGKAVDFIRCSPQRSQQEKREWEAEGFTVTIEVKNNPTREETWARIVELGLD